MAGIDAEGTNPAPEGPLRLLATGIRDAWIDGQRMRFTDAYAASMATEAVRVLEDAGYRIVAEGDAPRLTEGRAVPEPIG